MMPMLQAVSAETASDKTAAQTRMPSPLTTPPTTMRMMTMRMTTMRSQRGLSLLEMLMALALLAVVLGFSLAGWLSYRDTVQAREAQQTLAQALGRARSEARRRSSHQDITWTLGSGEFQVNGRSLRLPHGYVIRRTLPTSANSLRYTAPFGRVTAINKQFVLASPSGRETAVNIIGVTGKVVRAHAR